MLQIVDLLLLQSYCFWFDGNLLGILCFLIDELVCCLLTQDNKGNQMQVGLEIDGKLKSMYQLEKIERTFISFELIFDMFAEWEASFPDKRNYENGNKPRSDATGAHKMCFMFLEEGCAHGPVLRFINTRWCRLLLARARRACNSCSVIIVTNEGREWI